MASIRFWLFCCAVLFGTAELYQWVIHLKWLENFALPLPVLALVGVALAVVSNYSKRPGPSTQAQSDRQPDSPAPPADAATVPMQTPLKSLNQPIIQFPICPSLKSRQPISFLIRQSEHSEEA
ncbi:MAG: hypothetical protein F6K19_36505 [Cyanothece sp. SIO1E1]|nr:hypothetical protein [Cyanothece sp. SIO1E1]